MNDHAVNLTSERGININYVPLNRKFQTHGLIGSFKPPYQVPSLLYNRCIFYANILSYNNLLIIYLIAIVDYENYGVDATSFIFESDKFPRYFLKQ